VSNIAETRAGIAGVDVLRGIVPREAIERALRLIHLEVIRNGLPVETISDWLWSAHWFPQLKWHPAITGLVEHLPPELREGQLCDPQILLHPPDDCDEQPLTPHVDQEPAWAEERRYIRIVGVPLTHAHGENGGLVVWPLDGADPVALELDPGDVVVMDPALPHTSGLNREGGIRYVVYFRFLGA
jgi:hypothetical protein